MSLSSTEVTASPARTWKRSLRIGIPDATAHWISSLIRRHSQELSCGVRPDSRPCWKTMGPVLGRGMRAAGVPNAPSQVVLEGGDSASARRGHALPTVDVHGCGPAESARGRPDADRSKYASLDPLAPTTPRGARASVGQSTFVALTGAAGCVRRSTRLGLLIDGVHVGGHCIVVALGIDKTGAKHVPRRTRRLTC